MFYYQIVVFPISDVHFSLIICMRVWVVRIGVLLVVFGVLESDSVELVRGGHLRSDDFVVFVDVRIVAAHIDSLVAHLPILNNSV